MESLLLYLAVAHYGRGRGEWSRSEHPAHWQSIIEVLVAGQSGPLAEIWAGRTELPDADWLEGRLGHVIESALGSTLNQLYPESMAFFTQAGRARSAPAPRQTATDHGIRQYE